jgi:hypothetical protein
MHGLPFAFELHDKINFQQNRYLSRNTSAIRFRCAFNLIIFMIVIDVAAIIPMGMVEYWKNGA